MQVAYMDGLDMLGVHRRNRTSEETAWMSESEASVTSLSLRNCSQESKNWNDKSTKESVRGERSQHFRVDFGIQTVDCTILHLLLYHRRHRVR